MAPKRVFYEDDEDIFPKPGSTEEISKELKKQESPDMHNASFLDGMMIRSSPVLEKYTTKARLYFHDLLTKTEAEVGTLTSATQNELNTVKQTYRSIVEEPVLPNSIYVLTGLLSGSILVNRRALPIRFITPIVTGLVSFRYAMPKTFDNSKKILLDYEKEKVPEIYEQQAETLKYIDGLKKESTSLLKEAEVGPVSYVRRARLYLVEILGIEK
ncbi:unnamed protein product [Kuraishia capsulata CBS 1993]|uniref:MICOS complex subunit n=1 Tax=Kuraishia capsulata CBS 1993 TaxID=1382522 RepID=W6MFY7_9ASCO|nr:uncharacterized protein KUCA_T00000293001 [Kuraishia capsulata CBS 1993]CDK24333.1 unnamed protein product [Kuraishia capsulata CBS 1993]